MTAKLYDAKQNDLRESVGMTYHHVNPRPLPYGFPAVKRGEIVEPWLFYTDQPII
jgi:hypothetical protein